MVSNSRSLGIEFAGIFILSRGETKTLAVLFFFRSPSPPSLSPPDANSSLSDGLQFALAVIR